MFVPRVMLVRQGLGQVTWLWLLKYMSPIFVYNPNSELDKSRQRGHVLVSEKERWLLGLTSVGNQAVQLARLPAAGA